MYHTAGNHLHIYCDDEKRVLRVATDEPLLPGFRGTFTPLETFSDREAWVASPYFNQIASEYIQDMIEWFWYDLRHDLIS
ncbi:MAG: hypothetical protein A3C88_03000 [Candidatus Yanofskybacteria bacterium RIFCSPHIGHO2_02_FULL_50_12]|uniref:Uncharacterized protein n=1 Tax=Candidatus Yanofskybacteria bacterium RIFCSPHIGHO2_02_FULL_50_12 TaxID=1802685 RepID=A0A1F8FVR5_9BACT|nr:MAG: hypothetical protein A3C88_03000 [Candidatus Yanofskybacteria bacterium RIFCSPHIGHO2_02_FULL_50_12]